MRKWKMLLLAATVACLLLTLPMMAHASDLQVDGEGVVTAAADGGNGMFLASYDPVTGQFLGLIESGAAAKQNAAVRAIETDGHHAPVGAARSALVITEENSVISGGQYDFVTIVQSASGSVTLSGVTVTGDVAVYGGDKLVLEDCEIGESVEIDKTALAIETKGETGELTLTTALHTTPAVTVNGDDKTSSVQRPSTIRLEAVTLGNKTDYRFAWDSAGNVQYYAYEILDSTGAKVKSAYLNSSATSTAGIATILADAKADTFSFVLYAERTEIDRLDNCLVVDVAGEPAAYTADFDAAAGQTKINVSAPTDGIWYLRSWFKADGSSYGSSGSGSNGTMTAHHKLVDGDQIDIRVITSYALTDQVLYATVTPSSRKAYVPSGSGGNGEKRFALETGSGIGVVKAVWSGYEAETYRLKVLSGETTVFEITSTGAGEESNLFSLLPFVESSGRYTIALYGDGALLATLENALNLTVSGVALDYNMDFDTPQAGVHTITVNGGKPEGLLFRDGWRSADGEYRSQGYGSISVTKTEYRTLAEGDQYDLRVVKSSELADGVWYVIMTPPSVKPTEPAAIKATLNVTNVLTQLLWPAQSGTTYYWSCNGGEAQRYNGYRDGNGNANLNIGPQITAAEPGSTVSFVIRRDSADGEIVVEARDIVEVQAAADGVEYTVTGQADGTYRMASSAGSGKRFIFTLMTPEGKAVGSLQRTDTASITVAPYQGCTFDIAERVSSETGYGIDHLTVSLKKGVSFTPYDFPTEPQSVNDEESFKAAINKGGTVVLASDVTLTNCPIDHGSEVTLDLNGFTLDLGSSNEVSISNGKRLTVVDFSEGKTGAVIGRAGFSVYSASKLVCRDIPVSSICSNFSINCDASPELELSGVTLGGSQLRDADNTITVNGGTYGVGYSGITGSTSFQNASATINNAVFSNYFQLYRGSMITMRGCSFAENTNIRVSDGSTLKLLELPENPFGNGTYISASDTSKIILSADPTGIVRTACVITNNGDGTWTMTEANS